MPSLAGPQNAHWNRYKGDTNDFVEAFVTGIADNLDGVTAVSGTVIKLSDPTVIQTGLAGSVVDSPNFKVKIVLGSWLTSTAVVGEAYELRIVLTTASPAAVRTWPDKGMAIIEVK